MPWFSFSAYSKLREKGEKLRELLGKNKTEFENWENSQDIHFEKRGETVGREKKKHILERITNMKLNNNLLWREYGYDSWIQIVISQHKRCQLRLNGTEIGRLLYFWENIEWTQKSIQLQMYIIIHKKKNIIVKVVQMSTRLLPPKWQ